MNRDGEISLRRELEAALPCSLYPSLQPSQMPLGGFSLGIHVTGNDAGAGGAADRDQRGEAAGAIAAVRVR
jgi:hypothetical protein